MKIPNFTFYFLSFIIIILMCYLVSGCASQQIVKVPVSMPCTPIKSTVKRPNFFNSLTDKSSSGDIGNAYIKQLSLFSH